MRILLTNNHLRNTGGTENYTYALATKLKDMGHEVEYFTFEKGFVSKKLEDLGIPFKSYNKYDLIIANHNSTVDYLRDTGFIIQTCHGKIPSLEQPSPFANVFVAVSKEIEKHLLSKGIKSKILINGIDCERFKPTSPLHDNLTSVLSLCQSEKANDFIKECCKKLNPNIKFLSCNKHTDNVWEVEKLINEADLVVGIGRSLYDAMACGRCVISFDNRDIHKNPTGNGYINALNIDKCLEDNCIGRNNPIEITEEFFINELRKYNPLDGIWARNFALKNLNMKESARFYIDLFTQSINLEPYSKREQRERDHKELFNHLNYDSYWFSYVKSYIKNKEINSKYVWNMTKNYISYPYNKRKLKLAIKYLWYRVVKGF